MLLFVSLPGLSEIACLLFFFVIRSSGASGFNVLVVMGVSQY